jgi:hypothetical protein
VVNQVRGHLNSQLRIVGGCIYKKHARLGR